jgi:predicted anti-sigma-YlaC factor YlaD
MRENLKDILAHLSTDIDQETLLLYLKGQLSEEKKHEVEKKLMENEFTGDALEGLQQIRDKKQITSMVEMLNRDLQQKIKKKKERRQKRILKEQSWLYLAIFIFIILIVISYMIIHRMLQNQ